MIQFAVYIITLKLKTSIYMGMKKICVIGPCLKMGGIERSSCNFANSLNEHGNEVTYIAIFNQPKFFKLDTGIRFKEPLDFNKKSLSLLKTVFWLRKTLKKEKPDSIFVLNKFYSAIVLLAVAFLRFPVYISERSSPFFKWDKKINFFNHVIFRIFPPTGVVAQTSIAMKIQQKFHRKKVKFKVIPNAVRKIKYYNVVKKNHILAVGRFNDPNKGFDRLVEAFSKIRNKEWQLVFAGGDEDGNYLKQQAKKLGVLERIIFLGKVKEIDKVYAESKIFVIPSRSEGFPNALCEAMAAGLACISFDFHAGPKDIILHNNNGLLVENNDIEALSQSIDELITDENKRKHLASNALLIRDRLDNVKIGNELTTFLLFEN